jgi:ABC-2 type transport system ATP-binding protein
MSLIEFSGVSKEYRRQIREPGFFGGLKSLFSRKYEKIKGVNDISFRINKGEIVGYIGPNGAGKSTTVKLMSGILTPTEGEVKVNGLNPQKDRKKLNRKLAVVFGQRNQLWWDIPIIDSFKMIKYLYEVPETRFKDNLTRYLDLLDLKKLSHVPARKLSLGQRMRAELCSAFIHEPEILYLDEPTIGLDIEVKEKILAFLKKENEQKETTILITSHDMFDIERLSNRAIVIDEGSIMYDGSLDEIKRLYSQTEIITIEFTEYHKDMNISIISKIKGIKYKTKGENVIELEYEKAKVTHEKLFPHLSSLKGITNITFTSQSLNQTILNMYKRFKR